jgi:hypothetical protein
MRVPINITRDCNTGALDCAREPENPLDAQCNLRNEGPVGNDRAIVLLPIRRGTADLASSCGAGDGSGRPWRGLIGFT